MNASTLSSHQAGFSLIEVLISVLVLSFGIFGALKMQLNSMQVSQQSGFYSTGMELASEMAEILRGNQQQVQQQILPIHFQAAKTSSTITGSSNEIGSDMVAWFDRLDAAVPNARAVICSDSANSNSLTWECASSEASNNSSVVIKLGWSEQSDTHANPPPRIAMAVTLF